MDTRIATLAPHDHFGDDNDDHDDADATCRLRLCERMRACADAAHSTRNKQSDACAHARVFSRHASVCACIIFLASDDAPAAATAAAAT